MSRTSTSERKSRVYRPGAVVRRWLPAVAVAMAVSLPAHGADLHVDVSAGVDNGGCGSTGSPCASIQQAVNNASDGDRILVAQGTYTYQSALDPCSPDTGVVCIVEKKLTLLGGFSSPNWTTSDPASNPTIIDGQNALRGLLVKKTFPGSASDASLIMQGFTIERGRAEGTVTEPNAFGGGIKATLVQSIVLRDLVVQDCTAVGRNVASGPGGIGAGGGISINTSGGLPPVQATLARVELSGNSARGGTTSSDDRGGFAEGGGLFVSRTVLRGTDLTFSNNSALAGSSGGSGTTGSVRAEALGGGMAILGASEVIVSGASATGNSVTGGAASSSVGIGGTGAGGGFYVEAAALELRDANVRGNESVGGAADTGGLGTGGGVTSFDADVVLDRVSLIDNQASGGDGVTTKGSPGGGGAYFERAFDPGVTATVRNSIFADNSVGHGTGGGVVGGGGGGLFVLGNDATVVHTTFAQNVLVTGSLVGQAVVVVPRLGSPSHATIRDSIIADHTSQTNLAAVQAQGADSSVTFEEGLFAGNERDTNQGLPNSGTFAGLATMEVDATAGFDSPGTPSFDYHLIASSPAIDQAVSSSVVLDVDRTVRSAPRDWGADEYCFANDDDLVLTNDTVSSGRVEEACNTISAGPSFHVGAGGDLVLRAGARVVLGDGFSVGDGGRLEVEVRLP